MQTDQNILHAVQQAGQAIHACREMLKVEVARRTQQLVAVMAREPLSASADGSFSQLKLVARMHQEVQALEDQLRGIYQSASQLKVETVQVVEALPHSRPRPHTSVDQVEEAQVVSRPTKRGAGKRASDPSIKAKQVPSRRGRVSSNDDKVLAALKRLLKLRRGEQIAQAQIAAEAGIPVGSIGASLRRLLNAGRVAQTERGQYRLV